MFSTNLHAHHDLDDDLEGQGVNISGGHNSFGLTVSNLRMNIPDASPAVPDAVRTAEAAPVSVEPQKIGNGIFYMGGGTHASIAVEFRDHIYKVHGLQHAQGMVMAYLPQEKIVVEADLFTPPAPNVPMPTTVTASHRTFYNNVQRLWLDVQTIAPIHDGRTFRGPSSRSSSPA